MKIIRDEQAAVYRTNAGHTLDDNEILQAAADIIRRKIDNYPERALLTSPCAVREYLQYKLVNRQSEVFGMVILDNQHRVIDIVDLFNGTIDGAAVYPREVVRTILEYNGAAVVLYHNHPSGVSEPSRADRNITDRIRAACDVIDVRVLDHLIVGNQITSFAEKGLI